MAVAAAVILHETRGTTLRVDEWVWALQRRGHGLGTFLEPHNGHFSLVPLVLYKALFATVGIEHYAPYRVMIVVAHLLCTGLLFVYASRRIGEVAALLPAALLLTLGPGWQDILWPFQVAWLISLAAGLGALLALDRGDRRGDVTACVLAALSLASCGLGIPIALGLLAELLWGRRARRDAWIVAGPLALYVVWWLGYQETDFWRHNVVLAPRFAADAVGGALAAVTGLSDQHYANGTIIDGGAGVAWGPPLALAGAALLIWRLAALRPVPARVLTVLAMGAAFWLLTGLQRSNLINPDASRYVYVGALFVLLLAVELVRGVVLRRGVVALVACAAALAIVANVGDLRSGARFLRSEGPVVRADLGALELARASVPPGYVATHFPGTPFVAMNAAGYFAAARDYGFHAYSAAEIAAAPEPARLAADGELVSLLRLSVQQGGAASAVGAGAPPRIDAVTGGTARIQGGCVRFRPAAARAAATPAGLAVTVPAGGLALAAAGSPATVAVRRFAVTFPRDPLARLAPGGSGTLRPGADRATQPWHVRLTSEAGAGACALRAGA